MLRGSSASAVTVRVSEAVATTGLGTAPSVAVIVYVFAGEATVGVPLRTPVLALNESPVGSAGEISRVGVTANPLVAKLRGVIAVFIAATTVDDDGVTAAAGTETVTVEWR